MKAIDGERRRERQRQRDTQREQKREMARERIVEVNSVISAFLWVPAAV